LTIRLAIPCCVLLIAGVVSLAGCGNRTSPAGVKGDEPAGWIDPKRLTPSPVRRAALTAEQSRRVKRLYQTFREVDPTPVEKWDEDFRRDLDPEREIRIYEGMADAYGAYCSHRKPPLAAKKEAYQVVLMRSGAPDEAVLSRFQPKVLSQADVREILRLYKAPPTPVTVAPRAE
jgi:hypothetical protein